MRWKCIVDRPRKSATPIRAAFTGVSGWASPSPRRKSARSVGQSTNSITRYAGSTPTSWLVTRTKFGDCASMAAAAASRSNIRLSASRSAGAPDVGTTFTATARRDSSSWCSSKARNTAPMPPRPTTRVNR